MTGCTYRDTDLVVTMPESYDDPETKKKTLFQLSALMRNNRVATHVQVIHRARVPVISFQTLPDLGESRFVVPHPAAIATGAYMHTSDHPPRS